MSAVFSRYARALADVVLDMKLDATRTVEQVHGLVSLVEGSPDLRRVWESPAVPAEQKRALLDSIGSKMDLMKPPVGITGGNCLAQPWQSYANARKMMQTS